MNKKIIVLGGGIAGISATYHAQRHGFEAICYEAKSIVGGLIANFTIDGFRFDNAVHLSFSKNEYVRSIFDKTPYYSHTPSAFCVDRSYWLKHPIQNNLYPLPLEEKVKCIESFVNRPTLEPTDYKEWLLYQYGEEIYNRYPEPYTRKYWGLDPEKLSLSWIGDRMRKADIKEILTGAFEPTDVNHYYATEMRYPKKGGYFSFVKSMSESIEILCNKKAVNINPFEKRVEYSDGSEVYYDELISSLPLPIVCDLIEGCPEKIRVAANSLLWTTVDLISVGFNVSDVPPHLWFYLYDGDTSASRAYSPSIKSADNAPEGKSSLQFEIYNLSSSPKFEKDVLLKDVKRKILEMNLCSEHEIEFMHHKHLPFGNVVFDHGMEERRQVVLDYLKTINISTCGRFGEWGYLWSDQSLLSGKRVADSLCTG